MLAPRLSLTILLVSLIATASLAADRSLGPVSLTKDQTVFLHFTMQGPAAASTLQIGVRFFDAAGALVAEAQGNCPGDTCPPEALLLVDSARVTTVALNGAALDFDGKETMTVQPIVTAFRSGLSHLFTTMELSHDNAPARAAVRFDPVVLAQTVPVPQRLMLGPLTLNNGELARFNVAYYGAGSVRFTMFFLNDNGAPIGTEQAVRLGYLQSETIEVDGDAPGIVGVPGVIRAGTDLSYYGRVAASFEIIDKATGAVKALLSKGALMTSDSGGGAGD